MFTGVTVNWNPHGNRPLPAHSHPCNVSDPAYTLASGASISAQHRTWPRGLISAYTLILDPLFLSSSPPIIIAIQVSGVLSPGSHHCYRDGKQTVWRVRVAPPTSVVLVPRRLSLSLTSHQPIHRYPSRHPPTTRPLLPHDAWDVSGAGTQMQT